MGSREPSHHVILSGGTMTDILDEIVQAILQRNLDLAEAREQVAIANEHILALENQLANLQSVSGERMPTEDLPLWKLIFNDDFNYNIPLGSFITSGAGIPIPATGNKWGAYPTGWKDTSQNGVYSPTLVVSIENSVLTKHIFTDSAGISRVAALVPFILGPDKSTWGVQNQTWPDQLYGRYSIRFRVPRPIPGFKIAWLLWPDYGTNTNGSPSGTGGNGEIDGPETNLDVLTSVGAFVHHQDAVVGTDQHGFSKATDLSKWHTFTTEWSPNLVIFKLDGIEFGRDTDRIPNTPMHWVIQTETKVTSTKPNPTVSGTLEIDWAAAWKWIG